MSTLKTLGLAVGIAFAASTFAFAQQGNPATNAAASGGSGTHQTSQKTGSAANTQKVLGNQNGYRKGRRLYGYVHGGRCHMIHRMGSRHLVKVCR